MNLLNQFILYVYPVFTSWNRIFKILSITLSPSSNILGYFKNQLKPLFEFPGVYEVCFSNEFSTFTHKLVFLDWQVGDEDTPLLNPSSPERALTFMEQSTQSIHDKMNQVIDDQTHYRLREATGRAHGEDLNERVQMWSVAQLSVIVVVGILQVTLIRSFFSSRK